LTEHQTDPGGLRGLILDWWDRAGLADDLVQIVVVVVLALGVGMAFNVFYIWPRERATAATSQGQPEATTISMEEAYRLARRGEALLVDTQEPEFYREEHIEGAVNLPGAEFEEYYPDFAKRISEDRTLILYCEPGCMSKEGVAQELLDRKYQDIRIMREGVEEWEAVGYPVVRGRPDS